MVANRSEVQDITPRNRAIIQGPVTSFGTDTVTILNTVVVDTSTIDESTGGFENEDTVMTRAEFYSRIRAGDIVKARLDAGVWDKIEFEDD